MTSKDALKIDALLTSLWERGLPQLRERLEILDRAATAAAAESLTETSRMEALEIAHKLSGSLGMFGYSEGTEVARQIERILSVPPAASGRLVVLVTELRETLEIK